MLPLFPNKILPFIESLNSLNDSLNLAMVKLEYSIIKAYLKARGLGPRKNKTLRKRQCLIKKDKT